MKKNHFPVCENDFKAIEQAYEIILQKGAAGFQEAALIAGKRPALAILICQIQRRTEAETFPQAVEAIKKLLFL